MQAEFERFPFSLTGLDPEAGGTIIGDKTFIQTKRIQKIIKKVEEDLPPPPPTFNEQELQEAKEEAYRRGFNDGENKGKSWADSEIAKTEKAALALTPKIIEHAEELFERYNQFAIEQKEAALQLSLAIAKKMTASLPDEHFFEQVAQHTIECTEKMLGEPEIHIYVHPTLSDKMEQRLAKHFANSHEPGDVIIHAEEALAQLDCRIEWASGGMEYKQGSVHAQLKEMISDLSQSMAAQQASDAAADNSSEDLETQPSDNVAAANAGARAFSVPPRGGASANAPTQPEAPKPDAPIDNAVADAIASQLADDQIPPIPELPADGGDPTTSPPPAGSDTINTPNPNEGESNE